MSWLNIFVFNKNSGSKPVCVCVLKFVSGSKDMSTGFYNTYLTVQDMWVKNVCLLQNWENCHHIKVHKREYRKVNVVTGIKSEV